MNKIRYFSMLVLTAVCMLSCQKADEEFLHDDCTIVNIMAKSAISTVAETVTGDINQETGEIWFNIPRKDMKEWDLSKVKVSATVHYDVEIYPSLFGIKDLTAEDGYKITVKATQTGRTKDYVLFAKILRN